MAPKAPGRVAVCPEDGAEDGDDCEKRCQPGVEPAVRPAGWPWKECTPPAACVFAPALTPPLGPDCWKLDAARPLPTPDAPAPGAKPRFPARPELEDAEPALRTPF